MATEARQFDGGGGADASAGAGDQRDGAVKQARHQ
jgi:hypothetical protein